MPGLSVLDRTIGFFSPARAAQRGLARLALSDVESLLQKRGYEAAKRTGRAEGWRGSGGSASAEIGPAIDLIRRRTRDVVVNDGWGASFCQKLPAHIVGMGIVPRADSKEKGVRERCRDAWQSFVENSDPAGQSDFYGQSSLATKTVVQSGEALIRWYVRPRSFGLRVPLQCEVLEPDFIDTRRTEVRADNVVIQGIEFDRTGRRVAYWLFPVHPGEVGVLTTAGGRNNFVSERVPAGQIDHIYRIDRPGQVRGVPWLAPVLMTMRDISDYEEAELVRKKIAACLAFFVKTPAGAGASIAKVVRERAADGTPERIESVKPGRIHYLDPDQEVTATDPKPSEGYPEYLATQVRKACAGIGLPYASGSGDVSQANFSSMREGKLDFWTLLDEWQWHMLIPQHCRPAWKRVMETASLNGLKVASDQRAIYTPPKRPWVDPEKDVDAKLKELAAGLETWPDAVAERGDDPEDQIAEMELWGPRLAKAGAIFSTSAAAKPKEASDGEAQAAAA